MQNSQRLIDPPKVPNKVDPFVKTQFGSKLKESFSFRLRKIGAVAVVVAAVGEVGNRAVPLSTASTAQPWRITRGAQLKYTSAGVR